MSERPGTDPDRADVKAVLAGDAEAFGGIVERWQAPLVTLAYRYCRNRGQAEEMAQAAGSLGIPEGTLKARLYRARALLERKLSTILGSPRRAEAT